jgi:uncharacterized protein (TIGR03382 family)
VKLKSSWLLLLLTWGASACGEVSPLPEGDLAPVAARATRQQLPSTDKVLILDSSVSGGLNSREAQAVRTYSPTTRIDVLKPEEWRLLTAVQFMEYRTIIIGDAGCQSGEAAFQAAIDTRRLWGAIIDGDVVIVSTNPASNITPRLVDNAIRVALDSAQFRTGMYISLGCAYQNAPPSTVVTLLEPFGHFKVQGVPNCGTAGHFFRMFPTTLSRGITDGQLPGAGGCVARSVFTSYPDHTFAFAALATGTPEAPIPGQQTYIDYLFEEDVETEFVGTPYVIVKGATALSAGCGDQDHGPPDEECDFGDNGNGRPAPPGDDPESSCSHSCHFHWCGDGAVDEEFGEECDQGSNNGRSDDAEGNVGTCTGFCKIPDIGLPNRPPVAICRDVTAVATNTCGVPADINDGSYDPDGDLVGCVQNPPGPYLIGRTRVTLTCRDRAAQFASCAGMVTVTDLVAPTVTLEGPASDVMECTQGATYPDQGASARDICEGPLPVTTSGSVNMGSPGSYSLTYSATDSSGNVGTATRAIAVNDTLPPTVTLSGSTPLQHECGAPFSDPGALGTDQCAGTLVPTASGTVDDRLPGSYTLRYSVSDPTGHSAAQDRVVTVSDTLPPSITVRDPLEDTLECGSPYVDPGATANDMCAGPLPVTTTQTGSSDRPGTFTLSYSAIDPAGHEATSPVSRAVHVVDETPPTLMLVEPVIQRVECATPWSEPGAMASDACFGDLTSGIIRSGSVTTGTPGSYPLTYNVTDPAGHSAMPRQRTVNVQDTLAPSITIRGPLSVQLQCDHVPYEDPGATAADSCAGDLTGAVQRVGSVDTGLPGSYTLRYRVADPSGNQTTSAEARTVSVVDDQPPTIALNGPSSAGHECGSAYDDPGATANDVCAGDLTGSITRTGSVDTGLPGSYTLRYTVMDPANLSASTERAVNVRDTLAPTLSLRGPSSELVECGLNYVDPGATATDICAGNLDAQVQVSGAADSTVVGDYNVTYTVSDFAGNAATPVNRQVQVRDTTAPTLFIIEPVEAQVQCGTLYEDPGARAMDTCAGDLTSAIVATRSGDSRRPGSFTITYSVQDPSGNRFTSPVVRTVNVRDDLPPTLTLVEPATQAVECATPWNEPGVTASDLCFGDLTSAITRTGTVSTGTPGDYTLRYSVVDGAGNSASSVSRTVQVRDTLAPSITIEGPLTQSAECGTAYVDPGATARDACAGDLTAALESIGAVSTGTPGSYTLHYRVADPSGNQTTSVEVRTVTVVDEQPPTLELLGSASMRVECGSPYGDPGAKARDACAGDLSERITRTGVVNPAMPGSYTISYAVSDPANNRVTALREVSVTDTQPPSIVCPEPLVVETPENTLATVSLRAATATDVCSQAQVSMPTQTEFPVGTTELTYTATDLAGNSAKCTTTVTVLAIAKPIPDLDRALIGGGNGCSSTGGGPSSLAMMGLGVLASLLARKRTRAILPVLAVLLLGSKAVAQPTGIPPFELERLMLNPSARGSLLLGTGELLPHGEYRLSLTSHYENDPLLLILNGTHAGTVVQHRATMHLAAAYGLWGWVELGAQVPVVLLQRGDDLTDRGISMPREGLAAGTPLFSAQLKLLSQREDDLVDLSLGVHAGPAVGSAAALAREFRGTPTVMVGRRFEHLQTAIDAGVMFRRRTILSPDAHVQDEIGHALRLGATLSSLGEGLRGEVAILGSVPLKREGSSVETLAGARYPLSEAFEVYGLAGLGFGTAAGTPDFRVLLGVAFERPRPPAQVEVAKYEPELPLPMDSDADGVLDDVDRCPTVPGLAGLQGCPDDDGDGVEDGVDRCLGEAGPVDRQGCPERDSDGDGLVDGKDPCPSEAGPLDRGGCPVPDRDHDTVEDLRDNCPDEVGPPDNQGCPEEEKQLVVIQTDRIAIKDTVHFDFNKATIQPRSYGLLDQVARVLLEHPEIVFVSIEGHTDGVGPAEYNRRLSQRRAEAVRDYLAGKSVAPERMEAKGFGEDRPVQSNATSVGRAANRRVEFITSYTRERP